ncbi:MAG: 50S ribosomal protein L9 [Planctomycetes bacterium]|nr:50S ribosomal protein L9 [Planctomycetota bacterium]
MQVILKKSVELLGRAGDLVNVKPGYARNYLLPFGFAALATKGNLAQVEAYKAKAAAEEAARVKDLRDLAERLKDASVTIEGRANEEGHLFGSVTASMIARSLKEKGFPVSGEMVRLDNPIKEIGVFDVKVHLHADIEVLTKVWVVQAKP